MANPAGDHASPAGPRAPLRGPVGMSATPDRAASPGKVFVSTLIGSALPFAPFMLYWHFVMEELPTQGDDPGMSMLLLSSTNLLSVPLAAGIAGVDSLGRTMLGTGLGFVLGHMLTEAAGLTDSSFDEHTLAPPVFALTMAAATTLAIAIYEG